MIAALLAPIRLHFRRIYLEWLFWLFYCTTPLEREEFIHREDAADLAAHALRRDRDGPVTMREAWDHGSALYRVMKEVPPPDRKGAGRWAGL